MITREPLCFALRLSGGEPEPERRPLLGLDVDVAEDDVDLFGDRVQERSVDGSQVVFSCDAVTRVHFFVCITANVFMFHAYSSFFCISSGASFWPEITDEAVDGILIWRIVGTVSNSLQVIILQITRVFTVGPEAIN